MKYIWVLFLYLSLLLFSCTPSNNTDSTTQHTKIVALSEQNPVTRPTQQENPTFPFVEENFSLLNFPISIDTVVFNEDKKLQEATILELEKMVLDEEHRYALQLNYFINLTQLREGENPVESDKIDIGEPIEISYYDMGYTFLEKQNVWLVFLGIEYESYPACPWANGREIVLCIMNTDKKFVNATTVAENSEGGDPPVRGTAIQKAKSENGEVYYIDVTHINGEEDDNGNVFEEIDKRKIKMSILSDGKIEQKELSDSKLNKKISQIK